MVRRQDAPGVHGKVLRGHFVEFLRQNEAKETGVPFEATLRLWVAMERKKGIVSVEGMEEEELLARRTDTD